ncbi:MAG: hypothetical protein IKH04_02520 [Kiritimatiellae bacterium]|nr:hypothetical protein [Kiritimatiellia bacterium]
MHTPFRKSLLATLGVSAALALPVGAAWFDTPVVVATVNTQPANTDPHFINLSEDGAFLLVDWHSSNVAFPVALYSVAELKAISGTTNRIEMASALAGDFFGAGTGDGGWKGGAISARLGVAIPGSGKGSGALYTAFDVPALGWKADENAFPVGGLDGAGFDGLDFNAAGTRLYVNLYASGSRNKILAYDTAALKSAHSLSLLSTKTVDGVSRIRNLSCYTIGGKDLVYFGEGAVSGSNNSVYVYDPAEDTVTKLVTDAALFDDDIMNVKLSHVATGCPTMYVQTDNGRLHIFLLAPDGKSVTSAKPVKSFTPAECAALCGLSGLPANTDYIKFRNFEVTDDGDVAFFAFLNGGDSGVASPGLCVVKSGSTEDAYIASPNRDAVLFTDYFFGANSRIEVDFRFLDTANGFIFSPWEAGSGKRCGIWRDGGTYKYFVGDKGGISSGVKLLDTERHTVVVDAVAKKGHLVTGTTTNTTDLSSATFGTSSWPIMFLGAATGSTGALRVNTTHYARARIYGAKIYESGVLVRDYVPAVVNGVPCLYDRESGSIAADTRGDAGTVAVGGNVQRLTGDIYLQLDPANSDTANKGINTGYRMTAASRVEADFQISDPPGDCRPFGAWQGASGSNRPLIYINSKIIKFFLNTGGTAVNTGVAFDDGRQSFALDATDMTFYLLRDGIVHWGYKSTGSAITAEQTRPLALFADANSADGSSFQSPARGMKCWSFKISEGGTLVTNFLPHLSIDGACMKDALTGKVITPKVPRYFTYRLEPSGTTEGYVVKTTNEGATGFMTDWKFDAKSKVEGEFALRSTGAGQRLFGSWDYSGPLRTVLYTEGTMRFQINSSGASFTTPLDTLRHRYVIDFTTANAPTGYCYTGDTLTASGSGTALANKTDRGGTVAIMADGGADGTVFTQSPYSGARFWGLKAYESGQLVHDWVPAKKDGVVGIADKLTGVLLAANTANFAAGGDLWKCTSDAYVESSGNMVIDTGYHAKKTSRIEVDMMPLTADQVCYYGSYGGNNGNAYTFWNGNPYVRFNMKNTARDSAYRFCPLSIRFTAVTDFSDQTQYVVLNGEKIDDYSADFSSQSIAEDWVSRNPMGVCGAINDSGICTGPKAATMRCYAVRIYENDALVHLFVPYSGEDGVGLVDLLTGDKAFKHPASTGADPTYVAGPLAITASEIAAASATGPADTSLGRDSVRTVVAASAGASAYRWTRNGVAIGETASGTLPIGFRRSGVTDDFTVTPVYATSDGEVLGDTASFKVTYNPSSFILIFR